MGCRDTVIPESFLKSHNVICLTFWRDTEQPHNDQLCWFRELALHLHATLKLEVEISESLNSFRAHSDKRNPSKLQGVHLTRLTKSKTFWGSIFFLLILISVADNSLVSLLVGEFNNVTKVSTFYITTITFPTSATPTQLSKVFDAILVTQSFQWLVI